MGHILCGFSFLPNFVLVLSFMPLADNLQLPKTEHTIIRQILSNGCNFCRSDQVTDMQIKDNNVNLNLHINFVREALWLTSNAITLLKLWLSFCFPEHIFYQATKSNNGHIICRFKENTIQTQISKSSLFDHTIIMEQSSQ